MINRRHIRVKVMQSVYATLQSKNDNLVNQEKFLKESIEKMNDLYVLLMSLMIEVQKKSSERIIIAKKKHLPSADEVAPNTKFIQNKAIALLKESTSLAIYLDDKKLNNWDLDFEFVQIILEAIESSAIYEEYLNAPETSFEKDKKFLINVFKYIIAPSEKLADYFEGKCISWLDDIPFVNTWVLKDLSNLKENRPFLLGRLYKDDEDRDFVLKLYRKIVLTENTYDAIINEKTPNWDADRIAEIDLILIKMALCEFIHFPSIPTRVSINEYIEISKDYSSQKSSFFINGVLDKILKDYTDKGMIKKVGRGLM